MAVHVGLHVAHFLFGAGDCRGEHLHEQVLGVLGGLGHYARGHHLGEIVEAHDVGFLVAELDDLLDDGEVGVGACRGQRGVSLVHGFAEAAVVGILEYREARGRVEGEDVEAVEAAVLGFLGCLCDGGFGQAGEVGFVVNHDVEGVGGVQQVAVILDEEFREFVVDLYELSLFVGGERCALFGELAVVFLHHTLLHRGELQLVAVVVDLLDALEEGIVEVDVVLCLVEQGDGFVGHSGEGVVGHSAVIVVEDGGHTLQDGGGVFEREDGVVEVGHRAVAHDVVDGLFLFRDTGFDGRDEVRNPDLLERRNLILGGVWLQERVFVVLRHNRWCLCGEEQCQSRGG